MLGWSSSIRKKPSFCRCALPWSRSDASDTLMATRLPLVLLNASYTVQCVPVPSTRVSSNSPSVFIFSGFTGLAVFGARLEVSFLFFFFLLLPLLC